MKRTALILTILSLVMTRLSAQVSQIDTEALDIIVQPDEEETKVINFWATWCKPCVEELPVFSDFAAEFDGSLYFISLDFPRSLSRVGAFAEKKKMPGTLYLLDPEDNKEWSNAVWEGWNGEIPATLVVHPDGTKSWHKGKISPEELTTLVHK